MVVKETEIVFFDCPYCEVKLSFFVSAKNTYLNDVVSAGFKWNNGEPNLYCVKCFKYFRWVE